MPTLIAPSPFTIRAATADDLPAVMALLAAGKLAPNGIEVQFGPQFAVAIDDATKAVIGAAGVEIYRDSANDCGLLRSAVVHEDWRGRGIGAALTVDRLAWSEREQLTELYLLTETAADYWTGFGFVRIPRDAAPPALQESHEWKHGCPASAVAMALKLKRLR
jgi:N-acetylglutamate synthase-like GNAT family acetyltransferase